MNFSSPQSIANIVFLVIILILSLAALLSIYILIKYGRTESISILSSLLFGGIFVLQIIAAFATLQFAF